MNVHAPIKRSAKFHFYNELNDFLPVEKQNREFVYTFLGKPSVKDTIQAIGVPHTEIDIILMNRESVDFDCLLYGDENIQVFPKYNNLNIQEMNHLQPNYPKEKNFIVDVNLGKLAPKLRLLGFDTLYRNDFEDHEIVAISNRENRIILTRDTGILKYNAVQWGYWVRAINVRKQISEVVEKFNLKNTIQPFTRCAVCNGLLHFIPKAMAKNYVPADIYEMVSEFTQCQNCSKIYWQGSHVEKIVAWIADF